LRTGFTVAQQVGTGLISRPGYVVAGNTNATAAASIARGAGYAVHAPLRYRKVCQRTEAQMQYMACVRFRKYKSGGARFSRAAPGDTCALRK